MIPTSTFKLNCLSTTPTTYYSTTITFTTLLHYSSNSIQDMGWGNSNNKKKKSSPSSSSSRTSIIARVFPVSWFSKRKQKSGGQCEDGLVKREKLDFSTAKGRFYSMDGDEAYWRLSFADEKVEGGRRSTGGINPLWCDSDEEFHVPVSGFKSFGSGNTHSRNFSDMVMEIKKTREQYSLCRSKKVDGVEVTNHAYDRRSWREQDHGVDTSVKTPEEKVIFEIKPEQKVQRQADVWKSPVSNSRKKIHTSPVHTFEAMDGEKENVIPKRVLVSETKNLKELKGIKVKTESQSRKVVKQRSRVKAYSPRTECKIRALEEMRKARMLKLKKAAKERPVEGSSSIFDSFAVVKSSFDPYHDFRDSMVEMIIEKGIISSEDLEELLACYLTLNRDEYHDLIIQVFRQVWLDLNKDVC